MNIYQVEASKLNASAVFSVQASDLNMATKELYSLVASVGMTIDSEVTLLLV